MQIAADRDAVCRLATAIDGVEFVVSAKGCEMTYLYYNSSIEREQTATSQRLFQRQTTIALIRSNQRSSSPRPSLPSSPTPLCLVLFCPFDAGASPGKSLIPFHLNRHRIQARYPPVHLPI